jgi:hypothetical protein
MTERTRLLKSLATTIADYRAGELAPPTLDHLERWICQFTGDVQIPLLRELDYVLKKTYFTKSFVDGFLGQLVVNDKLAGAHPCEFWKGVSLLEIQQNGNSQTEMLKLFEQSLQKHCGMTLGECTGAGGQYIYLDDVLFSGYRIGNDLSAWISSEAPQKAEVHIIVIATHELGEWKCRDRLEKDARDAGKEIKFYFWPALSFENRNKYRDTSEVLWPASLPDNAQLKAYMAEEAKFPFEPRRVGGKLRHNIFSSEQGRQLLEQEFLLAGVRIRAYSQNPNRAVRPLGFSSFGLGFGSMIVTFRNCPNNCPLALWWGDPEAGASSPLSKWYPLFPRKTYSKEVLYDFLI